MRSVSDTRLKASHQTSSSKVAAGGASTSPMKCTAVSAASVEQPIMIANCKRTITTAGQMRGATR